MLKWLSNKHQTDAGEMIRPIHRMALLVQIPSVGDFTIGFESAIEQNVDKLIHRDSVLQIDSRGRQSTVTTELKERVENLAVKYAIAKGFSFRLI